MGLRENAAKRADIYVGLLLSMLMLGSAGQVFSRHGMVMLPAALYFCGYAVDWALTSVPRLRQVGGLVVAGLFCWTAVELVEDQRSVGRRDVDATVRDWITTNISPGSRIVVHEYFIPYLPRTPECLRFYLDQNTSDAAYARKLATNDLSGTSESQPFRAAVLNDEFAVVHWFRREATLKKENGYWVDVWSRAPRFRTIPLPEVLAAIRAPSASSAETPTDTATYIVATGPIQDDRLEFVEEFVGTAKRFIYRVRHESRPDTEAPESTN